MGQTYRFETQVGEGVPEGLCVTCYRCSGKRAGGRWVGVRAALSKCGDNARRIMAIPRRRYSAERLLLQWRASIDASTGRRIHARLSPSVLSYRPSWILQNPPL